MFCFCNFLCLLGLRICFCLKSASLDQNSKLISINAAIDLSSEHWWDLMTFESVLSLYSVIVCLCLKYLIHSSKWRVELGVWKVVFFRLPEKIVYSFFNFLFDVLQLGEKDLVYNYLLPLKESPDIFQIWIFFLYLRLFCPIWSY